MRKALPDKYIDDIIILEEEKNIKGGVAVLPRAQIDRAIRHLLARYHAEYALLFGSYARGDATEDSDIDVVVFGEHKFNKTDIFAFAEDLRELTGWDGLCYGGYA